VRGGHTLNPVPLLATGAGREAFADARSIMDVAPRIASLVLGAEAADGSHPRGRTNIEGD
jgi:hypothetical protein